MATGQSTMTTVAIVTRRLKKGKTYEDFRRAWYHSTGFGLGKTGSNRMFSMINIFDPQEVIVIGFSTATLDQIEKALRIEVKFRGENPLDDVIEPEIARTFAAVVSEDDFSAGGKISYKPPTVGGTETDPEEFSKNIDMLRVLFSTASQKRDNINKARSEGRKAR